MEPEPQPGHDFDVLGVKAPQDEVDRARDLVIKVLAGVVPQGVQHCGIALVGRLEIDDPPANRIGAELTIRQKP